MRLVLCKRVKKMKNIESERYVWENLWDIKVGKVARRRILSFYSLSQPFYTFHAISVHLTLLLFLTPTLFAPFISHLAGYCDKRITRFSPRENVSLAVYCTWKKTPDIKLKVSSRQLHGLLVSLMTFSRPVRFLSQDSFLLPPPPSIVSDSVITIIVCFCLSQIKNSMQSVYRY